MKKATERFDHFLTKIEENIIFISLFGMLAVVFLGVINRFILRLPLPWTEELARYLMIWATYIGASLGVKKSTHISIDLLTTILPEKFKRVANFVSYLLGLAFSITVIFIGTPFILNLIKLNQLSPAMRIPIYLAYLAVPLGILLMAIRYLLLIVSEWNIIRSQISQTTQEKGAVSID